MRKTWKMLLGAVLALLVLALVACGGGDGGGFSDGAPKATDSPGTAAATAKPPATPAGHVSQGGSSGLLVSNAAGALDTSMTRFEEDVQSLNARFSFTMTVSGVSIGANGFFLYEQPDQVYMNLKLTGDMMSLMGNGNDIGPMEVLVRDGSMYLNTPFTGWVSAPLADLGVDADAYKSLLQGHSPVDYKSLIESIGGNIQHVGDETLDGRDTQHYRVAMDIADLMKAVEEALGSSGGQDMFGGAPASGTLNGDIWVERESQLPYRMIADGSFSMSGQSAAMTMQVDFLEYNGAVTIPEAPSDAKSFTDAIGSIGQ